MSSAEEIIIYERLLGARETVAGLAATAAATDTLGARTTAYGRAAETARRRTWAMNQALFTMRRFAYFGTLGLIGAGAAVLKMGYNFNATIQNTRVALRPFFATSMQMSRVLGQLFRIAAFSPLSFKETTQAFRTMFPAMKGIGVTAAEVVQTIQAITDAMSVSGRTSPGQLNRVAVALQHLAFMGRLTGQVVLQLARDGLPIYAALRKELGLTADQIHNIGRLGIPSQLALRAITRYIETTPGWEGAARRQSRTLQGSIQTLKDFLSLISGGLTAGFFGRFNTWINHLNDTLAGVTKGATAMHISFSSVVNMLDDRFDPRLRSFNKILDAIRSTFSLFASVLSNIVLPAIGMAIVLLGPFLVPLTALNKLLIPLTHHMGLLRIVLALLIARILIFSIYVGYARIAVWLWASVILRLIGVESLAELRTKLLTIATALYEFWVLRAEYATLLWGRALRIMLGLLALTLGGLRMLIRGALTVLVEGLYTLGAAMAAMPWLWWIAAIGIVIVAIALLITHWDQFKAKLVEISDWIKRHWSTVALGVPIVGPFIYALTHIRQIFATMVRLSRITWSQMFHALTRSLTMHIHIPLPHGIGHFMSPHIPHFASGGHVTQGGWGITGDRGPELLNLPTGASVVPLSRAGQVDVSRIGSKELTIRIPVNLDGRQIAEVTARHINDFTTNR